MLRTKSWRGARALTPLAMTPRSCGITSTWAPGWRRWQRAGRRQTSASVTCIPTFQVRPDNFAVWDSL